ncbi:hypothetical protein [Nonomuraea sp. NPDC050691]|uniref:hypothetical protein n=1 Tax=Nonomuraea sp. NPDC050691 TaxID=3155661 RepID=UPI0033DC3E4C
MHLDDLGLLDDQRRAIDVAVQNVRTQYDPLFVCLGGSLAVGLGNATSDIDLIAVVPGSATTPRFADKYGSEDLTVDVEIYSLDELRSISAELLSRRICSDDYRWLFQDRKTIRDFGRIHSGVPMVGHDEFEGWRKSVSERRLRQIHLAYYGAEAHKFARDAYGAAVKGDTGTAWATSQHTLTLATEMLLTAVEGSYLAEREKFTITRLVGSGLGDAVTAGILERLNPPGGYQPEHALTHVRDRIELSERLTGIAGLFSWDQELSATLATDLLMLPPQLDCGWEVLLPLDGAVALGGRQAGEMSRATALVWLLAHLYPAHEIAARFASLAGIDSPRFVTESLRQITATGFIPAGSGRCNRT